MVDLVFATGRLLIALVLVALNGFFVASEFALVRVRSTSVEQLVAEGATGSGALAGIMENLDNYLAVTQLGITLASLGLGWAGEPAIASLLEPIIGSIVPSSLVHLLSFAIAFGTITFLHVVFGELAPKTVAIAEAERLSLLVAPPLTLCYLLFYPGIVVFNGTANLFTSLIGIPPASETDESLEERELRRVLARSGEAGHVDAGEVKMIERVFDLDEVDVRSIMVPRPDVTALAPDDSIDEVRSIVEETGHTRYPVVDGEDVLGFVDAKDLLTADPGTVEELIREMPVVGETTTVRELLIAFRDRNQQVAAVVDEWGGFDGWVTVEDAVEAIVGDIFDQFDDAEPTIRTGEDATVVDGGVPLSVLDSELGIAIDAPQITTVGGLVLDRLEAPPAVGDRIPLDDREIEVIEVDGVRVSTVRIHAAEADTDDTSANDDTEPE
ncbi:MAG: hemolysin family protein [Halococcoides sp.]